MARNVLLTDTEEAVLRCAMQHLRSDNTYLDRVSTDLNIPMGTVAQAAKGMIGKVNGGNIRHLVERATRR